jgi:lysophospholipase L1-like esterase
MRLSTVGTRVKEAWLICGITIVLLCVIEGAFALALAARHWTDSSRRQPAARVVQDTYPDRSWLGAYIREFNRSYEAQWRPYVYWRRKPFTGTHINIDADGLRKTVATPSAQPAASRVKIFMFGGSTLWGSGARDAFTIPSIVAQELQNRGVASEVINFGESGYVSTQELIALLLQLQRGQRSDLVIFYDGANDLYSAYQQRVAGLPQNEFNRVNEFNLSQPQQFQQRLTMVLRDAVGKLSTVRVIRGFLPAPDASPENASPVPTQTLARDVVATYASNVEIIKAIAGQYRFKYLFYWQPTIFQKVHLTPYEQGERVKMRGVEALVNATYDAVRNSGLADRPENTFHDLSQVFADMQQPLYTDWCHLGEIGNEIIGKRMADDVVALLAPGR